MAKKPAKKRPILTGIPQSVTITHDGDEAREMTMREWADFDSRIKSDQRAGRSLEDTLQQIGIEVVTSSAVPEGTAFITQTSNFGQRKIILNPKANASSLTGLNPSASVSSTAKQTPNEESMSTEKIASLIPNAETYIKNGFNVLLIGKHGTGKTESVRAIAQQFGMNVKSYSCSTLDPFTDLVGVPVPRVKKDKDGNDTDREYLKMVRPIDIDEADIVFFDELNRARPEVQDAVLEIINNRTINGEPLPNLKACWAAINPPNDEYKVDELDPALMDRFDVYLEFTPRPSVAYMAQHVSKPVAMALRAWYDDHQKGKRETYISPRRLMKIGLVFEASRTKSSVLQALPPGGKYDGNKLYTLLNEAVNPDLKAKKANAWSMGDGSAGDFDYTSPTNLKIKAPELAVFLKSNPGALDTHKRVVNTLSTGVSGEKLVRDWADVLEALHPPTLEAFVTGCPQPKQSQARQAFLDMMETPRTGMTWAKEHKNLYGVLNATAKSGSAKLPPLQ